MFWIFLGLVLVAAAIVHLGKVVSMLDFTRLNAALAALGTAVTSVADAIRNPQVDNNSQAFIDATAGKLEEVAGVLTGLGEEETALDNADAATEVEPVDTSELPEGDGGSSDTGSGEPVEPGSGEPTEEPPVNG